MQQSLTDLVKPKPVGIFEAKVQFTPKNVAVLILGGFLLVEGIGHLFHLNDYYSGTDYSRFNRAGIVTGSNAPTDYKGLLPKPTSQPAHYR